MMVHVVIFLLGMIAGAVTLMIVCVLAVDLAERKRKKPLTKEEWKAGLRK